MTQDTARRAGSASEHCCTPPPLPRSPPRGEGHGGWSQAGSMSVLPCHDRNVRPRARFDSYGPLFYTASGHNRGRTRKEQGGNGEGTAARTIGHPAPRHLRPPDDNLTGPATRPWSAPAGRRATDRVTRSQESESTNSCPVSHGKQTASSYGIGVNLFVCVCAMNCAAKYCICMVSASSFFFPRRYLNLVEPFQLIDNHLIL